MRGIERESVDVSVMAVASAHVDGSEGWFGDGDGYHGRVEVAQEPRLGDKIRTQYLVCVRFPTHQGREAWQAQTKKTYSELTAFRNQMQAAFPDVSFPSAPPKRPFQRFDPRVLQERARTFQGLFDTIGDVSKTWNHRIVLTFFGAPCGHEAEEEGVEDGTSRGSRDLFARTIHKTKNAAVERQVTEIRTLGRREGPSLDEEYTTSEEDVRTTRDGEAKTHGEPDARNNTHRGIQFDTRAPEPKPFTWKEHPLEPTQDHECETNKPRANQTTRKERAPAPKKAPPGRDDGIAHARKDGPETKEGIATDEKTQEPRWKVPEGSSECLDMARNAARSGNTSMLQDLLASGKVCPDARDGQGMTLLHLSALFGHASTAMNLLEAGANPTVKNHLKETPLQLASPSLAVRIREWMKEHPDAAEETQTEDQAVEAKDAGTRGTTTGADQGMEGILLKGRTEEDHVPPIEGNSSANEEDNDLPPAYTDVVSESTERIDSITI